MTAQCLSSLVSEADYRARGSCSSLLGRDLVGWREGIFAQSESPVDLRGIVRLPSQIVLAGFSAGCGLTCDAAVNHQRQASLAGVVLPSPVVRGRTCE